MAKGFDFLCFGGEDWWYHNRGHIDMQLMRQYAGDGTVLYVNSLIMQKPKLTPGSGLFKKISRKLKSIGRGLEQAQPGFWVYSPFSLPMHHIDSLRVFNRSILERQIRAATLKLGMTKPIIWVACPTACEVALKLPRRALIYQRTDRYEEFPNVDTELIKRFDRELKAAADLTIYVNDDLCKQEASQCKKAMYLDHGVEVELFSQAHNDPVVPQEIKNIKRPIVGFYGGIDDHTFDLDFMTKVIELMDDVSFVFVGKTSIDCSGIACKRNVLFTGQKPYPEIPGYGKCFDVAVMPWRQNKWIAACNPIKLKEYLALGKPIVSTPFSELKKYGDAVYVADSPGMFASAIRRALVEDSPEKAATRRNLIAGASWQSKAKMVLNVLNKDVNSN